MLKVELLEIIANGENSGVEFKRDDIKPDKLAKEIAALANFQGGRVILGVEDDGRISGISRDHLKVEERVVNIIRDKIHPLILPFYETIKIDSETAVAVITLPQGISKPYVVRDAGAEKIYIRVGSTSQLATREQQMRLFELVGMLHSELMPVPRTDMSCLDEARLLNYLNDIIKDPEIPKNPMEWEKRLLGLGFLIEAGDKIYCSVAGLVLFGKSPRRFLKQSGLRVFAFEGKDKEYKASLDVILDAPLVGRWDFMEGEKRLVDSGIIERFIEQTTPFLSQEGSTIDGNFRRETRWFYPIEALREVVVNALAHRDWTRFVDIEIGIYSDRVEIISPGALQNSMTIEKMIAGQRSHRNTIIMEVLRDYGYVDFRGMGVRTKIIPLMKQINQTEPIFEATEDYLKTVLSKKTIDA